MMYGKKITLPDGYEFKTGVNAQTKVGTVTITKKVVETPTLNEKAAEFVYDGENKTGVYYDANCRYIKCVGAPNATNAGTYEAKFSLPNYFNFKWDCESKNDVDKEFSWSIAPKELEASDFNFVKPVSSKFTGDAKVVEVNLLPIYVADQEFVKYAIFDKDEAVVEKAVKPGKYTVRAIVSSKNFVAKDVEVGSFVIEEIKFMEGDGSKYVVGSDGTLKFKTNGPFDLFEGVKVDGKTVDPKNYVVEEGSTLVTFKKAYAEKLDAGEHTIQFIYQYNVSSPEATFTIEAKEAPKTADTNTTWLWILLSVLGGLAVIAGAYKAIGSDI